MSPASLLNTSASVKLLPGAGAKKLHLPVPPMARLLPYKIIVVVTLLMEIMRVFLIPGWSLFDHVGAFVFQVLSLFFLWWMLTGVNRFLEKKMPFRLGVVRRLVAQVLLSVILSSPVLIAVDILSNIFFSHLEFMGPQFKAVVILVFILVITLICFSFYGAYFFRQWKQSIEEKLELQIRAAESEKERAIVQYQHLKNQVNPHFLFNTLTSLDGLIHTDPALASVFVRHLAKVYRYVLEHTENEIVSLAAEIEFIQHYISVLKIRYADALQIQINISEETMDRGIAMVTLQMLIDNAIKHNIVHKDEPLSITISHDAVFLYVTNNKQLRKQIATSTKKGLQHLRQLYKYLGPHAVEIRDDTDVFQVKIPLL